MPRTNDISNTDDLIDSRDVIARIEELEGERDSLQEDLDSAETDYNLAMQGDGDVTGELLETLEKAKNQRANFDEDNNAELLALQVLANEAAGYASDWHHGATLIHRSHFVEYCQEMLQDIGDIPRDMPGYLVIDWEATASNIEVDYTTVDFDGQEYLVR